MADQQSCGQLVTIADFARRSRLTTKALRIYDKLGLLRPTAIDPSNGYRRYSLEQVDAARLIGLLRGVEMSLTEIGQLLADLGMDSRRASERLDRYLSDLESRHTSRRFLIRHIHSILRKEEPSMFSIETRHVPAQRVMSIQRRLRVSEIGEFASEARAAFARQLGSARQIGPFILIFHGVVDDDSDGPIEAILGCGQDVQANDVIGIRTEPAHDEAFTTITKAQWDFPAILAAYDAVADSTEVAARPGSQLSCREVYVAEGSEIGDDDLICDVAFPLA